MLDNEIGYVKLAEFSETSDKELETALTQLKAKGMKRLMFDLRDNPGGYLEQALGIRTGAAPSRLHASPRIGFTYTYNRDRDNGSGMSVNQVGTFYRTTAGVVRTALDTAGHTTIPVWGVLCFVEADWSPWMRPLVVNGVNP